MLSRSRVGRSDDKLELREAGSSGGLDGITFALLQHTQLTAHAPTPFSGQDKKYFIGEKIREHNSLLGDGGE